MGALFVFEFILKAVLFALGILAWQGTRWAFIAFLVVLGIVMVADILLAIVFFARPQDKRHE